MAEKWVNNWTIRIRRKYIGVVINEYKRLSGIFIFCGEVLDKCLDFKKLLKVFLILEKSRLCLKDNADLYFVLKA